MISWLKKHWLHLFLIAAFCTLFFVEESMRSEASQHDRCVLCDSGIVYHAPLIVNLATGELCELRVYDPDPVLVGELAEHQQTGFSQMSISAGLLAVRDANTHTCKATISKAAGDGELDGANFCRSCRTQLAASRELGYALADLRDPDGVHIYEIEDGAKYTIRDYEVTVTADGQGSLTVTVTGTL